MRPTSRHRKFNPGLNQSDGEVIAQFSVRLEQFRLVIDTIEQNTGSPSNQHVLIHAPRGRGKTMLLARIAAELARAPQASWLGLRLFEESYYEIGSLGELWLAVLDRLRFDLPDAQWREGLARSYADLSDSWSESNHAERALAAVTSALTAKRQRMVLMVENLNLLVEEMEDGCLWALRKTLQNEPNIMLIATTTTRFKGLDDVNHAFYELFYDIPLPPLSGTECRTLWESIAEKPADPGEVRSLEILTGGSPRLISIVAHFAQSLSLRELLEQLTVLIDDHTEYFKSQLDALAPRERRVFLAVADLWARSTNAEVAARARIDQRITSSLLGRLERRGLITVDAKNPRRKYYWLTEGLFSIYYKLRRERNEAAIVEALIRFMVIFYQPAELNRLRHAFAIESRETPYARLASELLTDYRPDGRESQAQQNPAPADIGQASRTGAGASDPSIIPTQAASADIGGSELGELLWSIQSKIDDGQYAALRMDLDDYQEQASQLIESDEPTERVAAMELAIASARVLSALEEQEAALAIYDELLSGLETEREPALRLLAAIASRYRAGVLWELRRDEEALVGYQSVKEIYETDGSPTMRAQVAMAMSAHAYALGELGRTEEMLAGYQTIVSDYREDIDAAVRTQVAMAMQDYAHTLGELGRAEEMLAGYQAIVDRYREDAHPALRTQVAKAMTSYAYALGELDRKEEELAGYETTVNTYRGDADPAVRAQIAIATSAYAYTLGELGRTEEKLAGYQAVVDTYREDTATAVRVQVATAMRNHAYTLGELGRTEEELAGYQAVADAYRQDTAPAVRVQVAMSMRNRAFTLGELGRAEEKLADLQAVVSTYRHDADPAVRTQVAMAMGNHAYTLGRLGRTTEKLAAFQAIVSAYRDDTDPAMRMQVALAMGSHAYTLGELDRTEEKLARYKAVVDTYGEDSDPIVRAPVAIAMRNYAYTLGELGRTEEMIAGYQAVVDTYREDTDPAMRIQVAMAMGSYAHALGELGRKEEKLAALQAVVNSYREDGDLAMRAQVAIAMRNYAYALGELDRTEEKLAGYKAVVDTYREDTDPEVRAQVAIAMRNYAYTLGELDRTEEKLAGYRAVVDAFPEDTAPVVCTQVTVAMGGYAYTLAELGRMEESLASYDHSLQRAEEQTSPEGDELLVWLKTNRAMTHAMAGNVHEATEAFRSVVDSVPLESAASKCARLAICALSRAATIEHGVLRAMLDYAIHQPDHDTELQALAIATGAVMPDALDVIEESGLADEFQPLIVYLQHESGHPAIRAPNEVLQVASDVGVAIERLRDRFSDTTVSRTADGPPSVAD